MKWYKILSAFILLPILLYSQSKSSLSTIYQKNPGLKVFNHPTLNTPSMITSENQSVDFDLKINNEQDVYKVLEKVKQLYGMKNPADELELIKSETDQLGMTHYKFQQVYQGIPVKGAELIVHIDNSGNVTAINGVFVPNVEVDLTGILNEQQILNYSSVSTQNKIVFEPKLVIYNSNLFEGKNYTLNTLSYELFSERKIEILDAKTGNTVKQLSSEQRLASIEVSENGSIVYDNNNPPPPYASTQPALTYFNLQIARNYFSANFENVGYYLGDKVIKAEVNGAIETGFHTGLDQLYYHYGIPDDLAAVAHEFTHGVSKYTWSGFYTGTLWASALNESISDYFGVVIEDMDWILGNDYNTSLIPNGAPRRNLKHPYLSAEWINSIPIPLIDVPTSYDDFEPNKNKYYNMHIFNHLFYLISDAITIEKFQQILFRAMKYYLFSCVNGNETRQIFQIAAEDLLNVSPYNITNSDIDIMLDKFDEQGFPEDPIIFSVGWDNDSPAQFFVEFETCSTINNTNGVNVGIPISPVHRLLINENYELGKAQIFINSADEFASIYLKDGVSIAYLVHGAICQKYMEIGEIIGLGFPVSDEYNIGNGNRRSDFEHGYIWWEQSTGIAFVEYNTTPSSLTSFSINNNSSTTNNRIVILNNDASNAPSHYIASESSVFTGASWQTYTTAPSFTLTDGYGMKTVYFKTKNSYGESSVLFDQIEYVQNPNTGFAKVSNGNTLSASPIYTGQAFTVDFTLEEINGGPITYNELTAAILDVNNNHVIDFDHKSDVSLSSNGNYNYTTNPRTIGISGNYKVVARGRIDNTWFDFQVTGVGENPKSFSVQTQTILIPTLVSFSINNNNSTTTNRFVNLNNNSTNNPTHYMASQNSNFSGAIWQTYSNSPGFTLSDGYGVKSVYFKVKNSGGESSVLSDQIEYILSAPINKTLIKSNTSSAVYWYQNGKKFPILSESIALKMKGDGLPQWVNYPSSIYTFTEAQISSIPTGADFISGSSSGSDGLLIKEINSAPVYTIINGQRRWILSMEALNWKGFDYNSNKIDIGNTTMLTCVPNIGVGIQAIGEGETNPIIKSAFVSKYEFYENTVINGFPGELASILGFPISIVGDSYPSGYSGITGRYQRYDYGIINYTAQYGAYEVHGAIASRFESLGFSQSQLGFPVSDEFDWNGKRRSNFEGGYIYWDPTPNQTYVVYYTNPPGLSSFAINNGAELTTSQSVTLNNTTTNNPTHFMASENADFSGAGWLPYSTSPSFLLSPGYGLKTIYFKVKNSGGESPTLNDNINYVSNPGSPYANFIANKTSGNAPLTVQFTDQTVIGTNPLTSWNWDFNNDGIIDATGQGPHNHTYNSSGTYSVKLTVSDGSASDEELKTNYIQANSGTNTPPIVANTISNQSLYIGGPEFTIDLEEAPVVFYDSDGDELSYNGSYGGSYISMNIIDGIVTISPVSEGATIITITANDGQGGSVSTSFTIAVSGPKVSPSAQFSVNNTYGTAPLNLTFNDESLPGSDPIIIWEWDFNNDGTIDTTGFGPISYTYNVTGIYSVKLIVTDGILFHSIQKQNLVTVVENQSPIVVNNISNQNLEPGGMDFIRDLEALPEVFSDPDADALSYSVSSSDSLIALPIMNSSILTVVPLTKGNASITIEANDSKGGNTETSFQVSVGGTGFSDDFYWAKGAGGERSDIGTSLARDNNGNIIVTGSFILSATFGNILINTFTWNNMFIAKYDSLGNILWARNIENAVISDDGEFYHSDVCVDSYNNIYLTAGFIGTAKFGTTTISSTGESDVFVAKYDENGNLLWVRSGGGTSIDYGRAICIDSEGNCYASGRFMGSISFNGIGLVSSGSWDIFLVKYNSNGTIQWLKSYGGTGADVGNELAIDQNNQIYLVGDFTSSSISFESYILNNSNSADDIFITKFNNAGDVIWAQRAGDSNNDRGFGLTIGDNNSVYITGTFYQSTVFEGINLTGQAYDSFIAKYNSNGNLAWVKNQGGNGDEFGYAICNDNYGNIMTTGIFNNSTIFGEKQLTSFGGLDVFLSKFDSEGNVLWLKQAGGINTDFGYDIISDGSSNGILTGCYTGNANFSPYTLVSMGGDREIFLARSNEPPLANHRPVVTNPISDQILLIGELSFTKNLDEAPAVFSDADGDPLFYTITSSSSDTASVTLNETTITITPHFVGSASILVTAYDGKGGQVADSFNVFIEAPYCLANVKVFQQGTFLSNGMSTNLNMSGFIPYNQPYYHSPWSFTGAEIVSTIPSTVVDWVLLELRSGVDPTTMVARRAAFLKSDGSVVDLDGISQVSFNGISEGSYYIIVRHRNHLPIMSSNLVVLSSTNTAPYDFTSDANSAYGGSLAMIQLTDGKWGMIAGDINGSGDFSSIDYLKAKVAIANGYSGYLDEDVNLSGDMSSIDYLRPKVGISNGYSVQFPEGVTAAPIKIKVIEKKNETKD